MERFAQLLDDLEDLFYAVGLVWERIITSLRFAAFVFVSLCFQALGIYLAISHPPLAIAVAALLLVWLLYQAVVNYAPKKPLSA